MDPSIAEIFGCGHCGGDLVDQKYYLRGATPICQTCYTTVYSNMCHKCNEIIDPTMKSYTLSRDHYHEHCFVCSHCRKNLHGDAVQTDEGENLMCLLCWEKRYAGVCAGCGQQFKKRDKKVDYRDRQFHERCFQCKGCKKKLAGHTPLNKNDDVYCKKCYIKKFSKPCHKCQEPITTGGITVKELPFHNDCFRCVVCDDELRKQRFFYVEDKKGFICTACYLRRMSKQCEACKSPIATGLDQKFMRHEERYWHKECFNCDSCSQTLVGQPFSTQGNSKDKLVCKTCVSNAKRNSVISMTNGSSGAGGGGGGSSSRRSSIISRSSFRIPNGTTNSHSSDVETSSSSRSHLAVNGHARENSLVR